MDEITQEWLKSLKVGDKVAVRMSSFGRLSYSFTEILKVTSKGALRIKGYEDHLFIDGLSTSGGNWRSTYYYVERITEELTARLLLKKKIQKLTDYNGWNKLEEPVINAIYDLIPGI